MITGAPDVTMTLNDYGFELSRPLSRGRHVVRVRNTARQPHEVFVARLAPGKTTADALAWLEKMDGPPPLQPMGGVVGLATGVANDIALDLAPGEYGLFCFIPDAKDGKPHVAHGMVRQFTAAERRKRRASCSSRSSRACSASASTASTCARRRGSPQ
jgi:hypothetical protein